MAATCINKQNYAEGVGLLEEAIQYAPEYAPHRVTLGWAYERLGKSQVARRICRHTLFALYATIVTEGEIEKTWVEWRVETGRRSPINGVYQ